MEGENKTITEDLTCRYYVGEDRYVLVCVSESGIKVVDEVGVFENQAWRWTYVGDSEASLDGLIPTWEFKGRLVRRTVDRFLVTDAVVGNTRIIRVDWRDGLIIVRGRAGDLSVGEDLAWHLARHMPAHRALDVAAAIVDPNNVEEVRRQLRERLTRIDVSWPEPPMSVKFGREVDYYRAEVRGTFNVWRGSDGALIVRVPAACRKDLIVLEGGKFGIGVRCVANKPSKTPSHDIVAVKDGVYLTSSSIYLSAYLESEGLSHKLQCLDVGDRCLNIVKDVAEKRGLMTYDSTTFGTNVDIVEGRGYKAYAIDVYPKLFYVYADGEAIKFTERDIEKLGEILRGQKDVVKNAVENTLRHMGYSSVLNLVMSSP